MHVIRVQTERKTQLVDVTAEVRAAVSGEAGALVTVFVPHTTAGVVVQEAVFLCEFDGPRPRELCIVMH